MRTFFIVTAIFINLGFAFAQRDTVKRRELSFGLSMVPPIYPTFAASMSGNMPAIWLNGPRGRYAGFPLQYCAPINVNYRFGSDGVKNRFSLQAVVPLSSSAEVAYCLAGYGATLVNLNKKGTFSINGEVLIGYMHYGAWGVGGWYAYPKYYLGADLLLTGSNVGVTAQYSLGKKMFLENELYLFAYYTRGKVYFEDPKTCYGCTGSDVDSKWGMTFSKLLAFNLGFRL